MIISVDTPLTMPVGITWTVDRWKINVNMIVNDKWGNSRLKQCISSRVVTHFKQALYKGIIVIIITRTIQKLHDSCTR